PDCAAVGIGDGSDGWCACRWRCLPRTALATGKMTIDTPPARETDLPPWVRESEVSFARRSATATVVLVVLGFLALAGTVAILIPFAGPIVLAGALSITVYPVYCAMGRRWPRLSPTLRALLTDLAILMLVLVPVVLLVWLAAGQADTFRPAVGR